MMQLPEAFLRRMEGQLGNELPAFLRACGEAPLRGIRFHPLRETANLLARDLEEKIPWTETGWMLRAESEAGITVPHEAGAFYLQEPSAMLPAEVMDARPGEKLLDLCAAPGGKSTQMGCAMRGEGLLVCNEPVRKRAQILSRNIERMGIPNAVVTCAWPEQLAGCWPDGFDGVLVDAPCSGEGMFRRHPEPLEEWTEERARGCAQRQADILEQASALVRPGGRLVYSTCTWNPDENEGQIRLFLNRHPDYHPEPFALPAVSAPDGLFTCWPHRIRGEGQFGAKLRRDGNVSPQLPVTPPAFLNREENRIWSGIGEMLPPPTGRMGSVLFSLPDAPDVRGIQVLRIGLHLGEIRGKVSTPDHAAALHFRPPDAPVMDLSGEEALRYMAGESLEGEGRGWILLRYRGLVLGWGKSSEGRIRNHYPRGLRNSRLKTGEEQEQDDSEYRV